MDITRKIYKQINNLTLANAIEYYSEHKYEIIESTVHSPIVFIKIKSNGYTASVDLYHEEISDFKCDCVIGKNHIICKHVALACIVFENEINDDISNSITNFLVEQGFNDLLIDLVHKINNHNYFFRLIIKNAQLTLEPIDDDIITNSHDYLSELQKILKLPSELTWLQRLKSKLSQLLNLSLVYYEVKKDGYHDRQIEEIINNFSEICELYINKRRYHVSYLNHLINQNINLQILYSKFGFNLVSNINDGTYIIVDDFIYYFLVFNNNEINWFKTPWNDHDNPNLIFKLDQTFKTKKLLFQAVKKIKQSKLFKPIFLNDAFFENELIKIKFNYIKEKNQCELRISNNSELVRKYFSKFAHLVIKENDDLCYYTNNIKEINEIIVQLKKIKVQEYDDLQIDKIFFNQKKHYNHFNIKLTERWLNLKIVNEQVNQETLKEIYLAYLNNQKFIINHDEIYDTESFDFSLLNNNVFDQYRQRMLEDNLEINMHKYYSFYLNNKIDNEVLKNYVNIFENLAPENYVYEPKDQVLKSYQLFGVNWMIKILNEVHGCILADEMGLGKTIQTIYLLKYFYKQDNYATLLIVPLTLIDNWINEFKKFAPELSIVVINGNKQKRNQIIQSIENNNIYITTYNAINYDIDLLKDKKFMNIILDEGQYIKNNNSIWTNNIKRIDSLNRIILSGTPIENNLLELWTIFDFIMPGYLSNLKQFKNQYLLNQNKNNDYLYELSYKIKPFVLQRFKKDYLSLPDKIHHEILVNLSLMEKNKYIDLESLLKKSILNKDSKIEILAMITKLRQFCCDPHLVGFDIESSKLKQCILLLKDLLGKPNTKVVIFSSFKTALNNLQTMLNNNNIKSIIITGDTANKQRQTLINQFKDDKDINVLLLSLKVGGVGLNLNFANNVILLNPWWNESTELQAMDRLHRIGQDREVNIYKLISNHTIENNIETLKQNKIDIIKKTLNNLSYDELLKILNNEECH